MASQDSILHNQTQFETTDSTYSEFTTLTSESAGKHDLISVKKEPYIKDYAILAIIFIFIILAWIKVSSGKYLNSLLQSSFNFQTANRLFRERVNAILHPTFRLDIIYYIVMGFFLSYIEQFYMDKLVFNDFIYLLLNIGLLLVFVNLKVLIYRFISVLFKSQSETNEFIFYFKSNNRVMGIFLLPIAIIMFFSEGFLFNFYLILGLLIILFFSGSSLYRGFSIITRKDFSIYYLILYLCILEILPLLIVWRILW